MKNELIMVPCRLIVNYFFLLALFLIGTPLIFIYFMCVSVYKTIKEQAELLILIKPILTGKKFIFDNIDIEQTIV